MRKQSLMSDFEHCAGSLPFRLGMVDFDCCEIRHKFTASESKAKTNQVSHSIT